jgi:hypothetical protein
LDDLKLSNQHTDNGKLACKTKLSLKRLKQERHFNVIDRSQGTEIENQKLMSTLELQYQILLSDGTILP